MGVMGRGKYEGRIGRGVVFLTFLWIFFSLVMSTYLTLICISFKSKRIKTLRVK